MSTVCQPRRAALVEIPAPQPKIAGKLFVETTRFVVVFNSRRAPAAPATMLSVSARNDKQPKFELAWFGVNQWRSPVYSSGFSPSSTTDQWVAVLTHQRLMMYCLKVNVLSATQDALQPFTAGLEFTAVTRQTCLEKKERKKERKKWIDHYHLNRKKSFCNQVQKVV